MSKQHSHLPGASLTEGHRNTTQAHPAFLKFQEHDQAWIFMNIPVPFHVMIPVWIWTGIIPVNKHE